MKTFGLPVWVKNRRGMYTNHTLYTCCLVLKLNECSCREPSMERSVFNRQPARALILDLQAPMSPATASNVHTALRDVVSFLVHLLGPGRVPLFSLSVLRTYTECLFPLQPLKGNYSRVQSALLELYSITNRYIGGKEGGGGVARHSSLIRGSLLDGMQEALSQFQRLLQATKQNNSQSGSSINSYCPSQIEIIILTAQPTHSIQQSLERVVDQLDLENLKKIQVVSINDPEKPDKDHELEELSQSTSSPNELSLSVFDVIRCTNDVPSLQGLFKTWLYDCSTDVEHIQIVLPSSSAGVVTGARVNDENRIIIKCDVWERMLDPSCLPTAFSKNLTIQTGSSVVSQTQSSGRGSTTHTVPVYRLKSIGTVSCDGVCESVVYGSPCIVRSTCCWKLDWDELETNQQHFQALCYQLKERNQGLLLATDDSFGSSVASSPPVQVKANYILIPSPSPASLLLKAVVCNELLLPIDLGEDEVVHLLPESIDTLGESLSKLEHHEIYNPLNIHSGLYTVINSSTSDQRSRSSTETGRGRGRGRGGSRAGLSKRKSTETIASSDSKRMPSTDPVPLTVSTGASIGRPSGSNVPPSLPSSLSGATVRGRSIKRMRGANKDSFIQGGYNLP
ncbi:PREDICTED: meiosis 1 arrest protein-like [Amphimedon queenslandica]|uniref:Meiosis 1 arrest protein n=2 Tax=Amphimedon queenslandica TaxID=400682 RepID=A0AAN0J0N9_AMPQE|nr:PREDICTED: meiosis 1 arrest protein-like [Amphimedon queenslandica]|eukprot:XP_019850609.1 PREDICTED: meiosis 1 arrest protein-like [Amphimedon queenslandica]